MSNNVFIVMVREKENNNPDDVGVEMVFTERAAAIAYAANANKVYGDNDHWVVSALLNKNYF